MRDPQYNDYTTVELEHNYDREILTARVFDGTSWVALPAVPFPLKATPDEAAVALELIATYLRQGTKVKYLPGSLTELQSRIWYRIQLELMCPAVTAVHLNMLFDDPDPEWATCLCFRNYPGRGAAIATLFRVKKKEHIAVLEAAD